MFCFRLPRVLLLLLLVCALFAGRPIWADDEPSAESTVTPIVKPERTEPVDFAGEILPICAKLHRLPQRGRGGKRSESGNAAIDPDRRLQWAGR